MICTLESIIQLLLRKAPEMRYFFKFRSPNSEIAAFMKSFGLKNSTLGNITKIYSFATNVFHFLTSNGNPSCTDMQVVSVNIL